MISGAGRLGAGLGPWTVVVLGAGTEAGIWAVLAGTAGGGGLSWTGGVLSVEWRDETVVEVEEVDVAGTGARDGIVLEEADAGASTGSGGRWMALGVEGGTRSK